MSTLAYRESRREELVAKQCVWVENANVLEKKTRWALRRYKHRGTDWFVDVPSEDVASIGSWA